MKLKYKKYTGKPGFNDFVSMVWQELISTHGDWRWSYFTNYSFDRSFWDTDGNFTGFELPKLNEPKDFDPKDIQSFIKVYDELREWKTNLEAKEKQAFMRFVKDNKGRISQKELLRNYINKMTWKEYPTDSDIYKKIYNTLRQRLK